MPGPLPTAEKRRRNKPVVPTRQLPAKGRTGRAPKCPHDLGEKGQAWWAWAWKLPQATQWDSGSLYVVARRAQLEDDIRALEDVDGLDFGELLGEVEDRDAVKRLEVLVRKLKALAGSRVSVMGEMRQLDNRLGLNPKAMAELRWSIGVEPAAPSRSRASSREHLRAV